MAPKRMQERRKGNSQEVELKIVPEVAESTSSYYCNFAGVTHSRYDFVLTLARFPTTLKPEQQELVMKGKPLPVEAALQVIVSPQLVPGLIRALSEQMKNYEARFGRIERRK